MIFLIFHYIFDMNGLDGNLIKLDIVSTWIGEIIPIFSVKNPDMVLQDVIKKTDDALNHVVVLRPESVKVEYYFPASWMQEPESLKTLEEF